MYFLEKYNLSVLALVDSRHDGNQYEIDHTIHYSMEKMSFGQTLYKLVQQN